MRNFLTTLVQNVGRMQRENFQHTIQTLKKGTWGDFLTSTDLASEAMIIDAIHKSFPTHAIIAEESGAHDGNAHEGTWYVDPLDGTGNFAHGIPFFSVSIAFQKNDSIVASAIYDPIHDECFSADETGFYVNDQKIVLHHDQRLHESIIGTEIPPNKQKEEEVRRILEALPKFFWNVRTVKSLGSTALSLAYVAAGRLGGFVLSGLFYPWDIAAGIHCIQMAGMTVTDWEGHPASPSMGSIITASPTAHKEFLTLLARHS